MSMPRIRSGTRAVMLTAAAAAALSMSGCSTIVSGRKAGAGIEGIEGIHYWLPQPILVVTPQTDGSLKVEPDSIIDERNEYVLSASSLIGSYTFEVKVDKGLLTSVNMDADNTVVGKALVEAQRDIEVAKRDAEKAKADKAAAALTAHNEKVEIAKAAVRQAQYALDAAIAERDRLIASGADKVTLDHAEQTVTAARSTLHAAEQELAYTSGLSMSTAKNTDRGAQSNRDAGGALMSRSKAAGPVIYRIEQWRDDAGPSVRLVEAQWSMLGTPGQAGQVMFDTVRPPAVAAGASRKASFEIDGAPVVQPDGDGTLKMALTSDVLIAAIEPSGADNATVLASDGTAEGKASLVLAKDGKRIDVSLPKNLKAGKHKLGFSYKASGGSTKVAAEKEFTVKR